MGEVYAAVVFGCCDLVLEEDDDDDGVGESRVRMGVTMRVTPSETKDDTTPPMPPFALPPLRLALNLAINLGNNVNPAASTNATAAVLTTSDSKTARKEDHAPFDAGVRCANSTGERRGRSSDTARLDVDRSSDAAAGGGRGGVLGAVDAATDDAAVLMVLRLLAMVDIVPAEDADSTTLLD